MCGVVCSRFLKLFFAKCPKARQIACSAGVFLGERNPFRVRIVVAAVVDGTYASKNICAPEENACTAGYPTEDLKTYVQICYVDFG